MKNALKISAIAAFFALGAASGASATGMAPVMPSHVVAKPAVQQNEAIKTSVEMATPPAPVKKDDDKSEK